MYINIMFGVMHLSVSKQPFASVRYKTLLFLYNDYLAHLRRKLFSSDFIFSVTLHIIATQDVNIKLGQFLCSLIQVYG